MSPMMNLLLNLPIILFLAGVPTLLLVMRRA